MNLIIRNVPDSTAANIKTAADAANISQQELLAGILERHYGDSPAIAWWIDVSKLPGHRGEIIFGHIADEDTEDDVPDCIECSQPIDRPFVALMSDGTLSAVVCSRCATSE